MDDGYTCTSQCEVHLDLKPFVRLVTFEKDKLCVFIVSIDSPIHPHHKIGAVNPVDR